MPATGAYPGVYGDGFLTVRTGFAQRFALLAAIVPVLRPDAVHRPVTDDIAAEVENQAVRLVRMEPEAAPDHLVIEAWRSGRTQKHHAVHVRRVEAGRQHADVDEILDLATLEVFETLLAEAGQRVAEHRLGGIAELPEFRQHVLRVFDAAAEDQNRFPVAGVSGDLGAGRFHQLFPVHQLLGLAVHELSTPDMQSVGVDDMPCRFAAELAEISVPHQFLDADFEAHLVEDVVRGADRPGAHAVGRRREADHPDDGIDRLHLREEFPVHPFAVDRDEMRFVDDDKVKLPQFACPAVDRLDSGDDALLLRLPAVKPGGIDADVAIGKNRRDLVHRLLEQFPDVRQNQHPPLPAAYGVADDGRQNRRLASGGRNHHAGIVVAVAEMPVNSVDRGLLIRS